MYIEDIAHYVPSFVLENEHFARTMKTTPEWIEKRTGIKQRRTAVLESHGRPVRHMAEKSVLNLQKKGIDLSDIDLIISCSGIAEENYPNVANYLAQIFSIPAPGVRINSACSSLITGLRFARQEVSEGKKVLLVCSESFTVLGDYKDRSSSILFGDGAVALKLTPDAGKFKVLATEIVGIGSDVISTGSPGAKPLYGVLDFCLDVMGTNRREKAKNYAKHSPGGYGIFQQDGKKVYKRIVKDIPPFLENFCHKSKVSIGDTIFIGHQANLRMLEALEKRINPRLHLHNVENYGNTGAAGCGIVLSENMENIKSDEKVLMSAFGAGLVYGAILLQKI